MNQPKKWREPIISPFSINFENFKLLKIIGYPHARNDIFYVKGIYQNKIIYAYLKYARVKEANLLKEVSFLKNETIPHKPKLIEYADDGSFILTKAIQGKRLSVIVGNNENLQSLEFLENYGKKLAKIHKLNIKCEPVLDRKFFHLPTEDYCIEYGLEKFRKYLLNHQPKNINYCFCHGDFHYANVLWKNKKISGILDYELSGISNKEFDIAWSIFRRPGQKFMTTNEEIDKFLNGYKQINSCDINLVKYYIALNYLHFYKIGINDDSYISFILKYLNDYCK